jgi:hypothetical protein
MNTARLTRKEIEMASTAVALTLKSRPMVGRANVDDRRVQDAHEQGGDEDHADRHLLADVHPHGFGKRRHAPGIARARNTRP